MKARIASALASGLVLIASSAFAQQAPPAGSPVAPATPPAPNTQPMPGVNKGHEHRGQAHQQWEDCMARQEAKYGGVKTVGQHPEANNKTNYRAMSKGKPLPPDEKIDAKKGEKEDRHQAEMDDCREQLYNRDAPAPAKK